MQRPFARILRAALPAIAAVSLASLALGGCSQTTVVLWTDSASLAPAVELFNASQSKRVVELVYKPDVASALRQTDSPPDLVIGKHVEDQATTRLLQPLDRLLRRDLDPASFYSGLLAEGVRNSRHYLLPVSFDLPVVYFVADVPLTDTSIVISPDEMKSSGAGFDVTKDNAWTKIAYSPIWNPDFLYQYLRLQGFQVSEGRNGEPTWQFESVVAGISAARAWIDTHGGADADLAFQEKYLYDPQAQLVRQGRVAFGYDTVASFLTTSDAMRDGLRFRWFGEPKQIRVLEGSVFAGIPVGARSAVGAQAFLTDLLTPDRQAQLMRNTLQKRAHTFGIAGGLSSLWEVNETSLTESYPDLTGLIPPAAWLVFPPAEPRHWSSLVTEVVEPWIDREVIGSPQSRDLEASVQAWLLQQED